MSSEFIQWVHHGTDARGGTPGKEQNHCGQRHGCACSNRPLTERIHLKRQQS